MFSLALSNISMYSKGMYYIPWTEQTTITVTNQQQFGTAKSYLRKKKPHIYIKNSQAIIHNY